MPAGFVRNLFVVNILIYLYQYMRHLKKIVTIYTLKLE